MLFRSPFQDYGGPGDHIDPSLLNDADRFYRIPLGGRPMAVRFSRDGQRVFVANYLLGAVQVVDLQQRSVVQTIDLGGATEPSLMRRGEAISMAAEVWISGIAATVATTKDTRTP